MAIEGSETGPITHARPAWVLIRLAAAEHGFKTTLAFRRWCKRVGVTIHTTGRKPFVMTADVDRAALGKPPPDRLYELALASAARAG